MSTAQALQKDKLYTNARIKSYPSKTVVQVSNRPLFPVDQGKPPPPCNTPPHEPPPSNDADRSEPPDRESNPRAPAKDLSLIHI